MRRNDMTDAERMDALEARIESQAKELAEANTKAARLEEQLQQQNVAKFDDGTEMHCIAHVVHDRFAPVGLNPALGSFYAASQAEWKNHPHNEAWARRNGYRKATASDFVETDEVKPEELFAIAEGASGDLVLYVCPIEHQRKRRHEAEVRSAIAANAPLPEFRGPDGDATARNPGNGTS